MQGRRQEYISEGAEKTEGKKKEDESGADENFCYGNFWYKMNEFIRLNVISNEGEFSP